MTNVLAGLFAPIFWVLVLSVALWLTRRFAPKWERPLFRKYWGRRPVADFALKAALLLAAIWGFHALFSR